jgi:hypothetical protein
MSILVEQLRGISKVPRHRIVAIAGLLFLAVAIGYLEYYQYDISLVVGGMILFAVLALILVKPEVATLIVLFVLYSNLAVVAIRFHSVPAILVNSFFLLLGLPLVDYVVIRRQKPIINPVFCMMVGYLALVLISAAFSQVVANSQDRIVTYVIEGMALYFLVINTVRTPDLLRKVIWVFIVAGFLMGSLSLYQEITHSYGNSLGGLATAKKSTIDTGRVDTFGLDIQRQRAGGPLDDKNRYAQIMVVLLPLALLRVRAERSWILRLFGAIAGIPILAGALLTFSRGAGIAVIATLLAAVLMRLIKLRHFLVTALVGYFFVAAVIPDYLHRISTVEDVGDLATGDTTNVGGSILGRATVNLAAFHIFLDHPLLGVGPGQTRYYTMEYGNQDGFRVLTTDRRAHNMYLEELADTGIIGFVGFMGIVLFTMYQLVQVRRRWARSRPDIAYTAASIWLAIIAYLASAAFLHLSYIRYYWLLLALAGAAIHIFSRLTPTEAEPGNLQGFMKGNKP